LIVPHSPAGRGWRRAGSGSRTRPNPSEGATEQTRPRSPTQDQLPPAAAAQGALDAALSNVKERRQFDKVIADFQGIQFMLADMATRLEAARQLVYLAASKSERHEPDLGAAASASHPTPPWRSSPTRCSCSAAPAAPATSAQTHDARRQDHPNLRRHQSDPVHGYRAAPAERSDMMADVSKVGVVGCGLMGSGIAEVCARAGLDWPGTR
jgi:hypothetical protein